MVSKFKLLSEVIITLQLSIMTPKVTIHNGKVMITTEDVADYVDKQHHHVVQK